MIKKWKMALGHIGDNLSFEFFMMLELALILAFSAVSISSFLRYTKTEKLYEQLQLYKVAEVSEANLSSLAGNVKIINDKKGNCNLEYQGQVIQVDRVSATYFSYLNYPLCKGTVPDSDNTSVVQGVFSEDLGDKFAVGNTYTFYDEALQETIKILMVGQLEGNYIYRENSQDIGPVPNHILVYDGGNLLSMSASNDRITVWVENKTTLTQEQLKLLNWVDDYKQKSYSVASQLQTVTMVLGILFLVLGFSILAGYKSKQNVYKEEIYGIYYLCGASWKECVQIQLIEDIIVVGFPLCITTLFLCFYDIWMPPTGIDDSRLSLECFCIMVIICLLTFMLTSLRGLLQLRKKSPVAILKRWE